MIRTPRHVSLPYFVAACVAATACTTEVVSRVDEGAANRVVDVLARRGIAAEKTAAAGEGGFRVEVPAGDGTRAAAALRDEGLPEREPPTLLEALSGSGLVPSRSTEHERWLAGVAGELERTLGRIDRVASARVHLAVPRRDALAPENTPAATAAVVLRHRGANPISADDVKRLVSNAVPGLPAEAVTVLSFPVESDAPPPPVERLGPFSAAPDVARRVRWFVAAALGANIALVACVAFAWRRFRKGVPRPVADPPPVPREAR